MAEPSTSTAMPSSTSARRIDALTRQLAATPLAVSTRAAVMAELARERQQATFASRAMTHFLDGGAKRTAFRETVMALLESYPELAATPGAYDLSLAARREATLNKVRRLYQLFYEHGTNAEKRSVMAELAGVYDLSTWVRNGVHFGLFVGAIMSQGDTEQQDAWLASALTFESFGSFAMTELGHGSYTRGLETTATYDRNTDEFVIHTPTDTATKWWIGAAGETATHTVCYAQLLIDGESKGIQSFYVQLRDPQRGHLPLPGVRIGDCGAKMGLGGVDNGWIQFDHVRIPRFHMLKRFARVTRDGTFVQTHRPQMAYAALIGTRGKLVTLTNGMLKKALTITIRYCATRRQGVQISLSSTQAEATLLDYQSHQMRLMPLLARAFAYHFQSSYIEALVERFEQASGASEQNDDDSVLADIHGTMAGLKAFSTWDTLAGIEACRQCCGGAGYSAYNGLASLLADFSVMVTFEGDNTVMALQTAAYLLRSVEAMTSGHALAGSVRYLETVRRRQQDLSSEQMRWGVATAADLAQPTLWLEALDVFAGTLVLAVAAKHTQALVHHKSNPHAAWNACHVDLLEAARVHVFYTVAARFVAQIQELQTADATSALVAPLTALCELFVLQELDRSAAFFLQTAFMTPAQCALVRDRVVDVCARVRVDAVALVDAFNLRDVVLNSAIGHADGDVYSHILDVATGKIGVSPYFESSIKPMLEGEQLEDVEEVEANAS